MTARATRILYWLTIAVWLAIVVALAATEGRGQTVAGKWIFLPDAAAPDPLPAFDPLKQPLVNIELLGCVGDDPAVDNGPLLTKALARFGRDLEGIAFVPAKRFWCKTTATPGQGVGLAILGVAPPDQARGDLAWKDQPVSMFSWNGPDGGTLYRINRAAHHIEGVGFSGKVQPDNKFEPSNTTLVEITQAGTSYPVSHTSFRRVAGLFGSKFISCARAGNHADYVDFQGVSHWVGTPYEINENQSVDHEINLKIKGSCDTAINARAGGRVNAKVVTTGNVGTILSLGDAKENTGPTSHNGRYTVDVWTDGGDVIDTLVREQTTKPAYVSFRYWKTKTTTINREREPASSQSVMEFEAWPKRPKLEAQP